MDYVICIPSYSRPKQLKKKTLNMLNRYNISHKIIHIYTTAEQLKDYKKICGNSYNFHVGEKGIKEQRNFIGKCWGEGQKMVSLDDDISNIYRLHLGELIILEDLNFYILNVFEKLIENNCSLSGLYPIANPFYMKDYISYDLKFIIGNFCIYFNRKKCEEREFTLLEDYEKSLKYYLYDKKVRRDNSVCVRANYATMKGGLQEGNVRTEENKINELNLFLEKYRKYCSNLI